MISHQGWIWPRVSGEVNALPELEISVNSPQIFSFAAATTADWARGAKGLGDLVAVKRGARVSCCWANSPFCTFTIVTNYSFLYKDTFLYKCDKTSPTSHSLFRSLLLQALQMKPFQASRRSCGSSQTALQHFLSNGCCHISCTNHLHRNRAIICYFKGWILLSYPNS